MTTTLNPGSDLMPAIKAGKRTHIIVKLKRRLTPDDALILQTDDDEVHADITEVYEGPGMKQGWYVVGFEVVKR